MMSLLPLLFSAWWADLEHPHRLLDQNFGLGLLPEQLLLPRSTERMLAPYNRPALELYYRPLAELLRTPESGTSTITADKDTFKVMLDVQQFKPEEINLKLVDRFIVVEAKHEEKRDEHGLISRQFIRKYLLPEQVDEEQLTSNISSDGILTITAPIKATQEKPNERIIKIERTGKPAIRADTTAEKSKTTTDQTTTGQAATDQTATATNEPEKTEEQHEEVTPNSQEEQNLKK
ncbi:protein lethal(2)essential for life [Nomia melanderi]|uniref:protein lethal(2)essential for life n=1 Tax=Nomia melanderi TaxID=2448451 RepID=UPI0013042307|nr:protein lethal(2)essential for life-like [Nomia melanderi]